MSQPRGSRHKRGWLLANLIGGTVLIVVLSFALSGGSGSGQPRPTTSALKAHATDDPASCTQFQQMVGQCGDPATTTTTAPSTAAGPTSSGGSGRGSTTYSYADPSASNPAQASPSSGPGASSPTAADPPAPTGPAPCSGTTPPVAAPSGSWHCTLDDEFNGNSLDPNTWSVQTTEGTGYTTGPLGRRVCYVNSPQTVSVSGGYLNLSVVQLPQAMTCQSDGFGGITSFGSSYIGGDVLSYQKFTQEFGYFQVRAAMPATQTPGLQETLWLYPENETLYGPWPDSGEIDFAEFYSELPNTDFPVNHYPGNHNDPNDGNECTIAGQSTAGQFHTYALQWTPTTLTEYYDGTVCQTDVYAPYVTNPDTAPQPFDQPFFLTFTAALGGYNSDEANYATQLPATTQIDWVRVWQYG